MTGPEIPNLRHLRMVQVIGRLGGVSCASRELSTSQPAVTQAVANLEAELGTPIFERCATGTYPTRLGQVFLTRVDRFLDIVETAVHEVLDRREPGAGKVWPQVDRLITGTQMRSLIVTSEPAQLAATARRLGLSPASLFRSVRTLERTLDQPLFDRSAQGPIPNRTGSYLAQEFRRAFREIEFARGEVLLEQGQESLEIVIGALPMAGSFELAEAVRGFMTRCRTARVDMIFGLLRRPDWVMDVEEEVMFRDSYCVVMRPGHPLARLPEVTPEALRLYDWVVPGEGTPRRQRIEALFEGMAQRPRFALESSSLGTCRALLLNSDLLTVMTRSEVQLDASLGMVTALPCRALDAVPPKGVTTRADWLPTAAHRLFLDCLRETTARSMHEEPAAPMHIRLVS